MPQTLGKILIIASYNGTRHQTMPASQMLKIQNQQLTTLKHSLDRILIVVNEANASEDYEEALRDFIDPLRIPNGPQGSYGAWRAGYLDNPDYEWYFFLEDDYTFFMDDFDQKMIDLWTPETTYLAERVDEYGPHGRHTSISNGLTRGDILASVNWNHLTAQGQYNAQVQVGWSRMFGEGTRDITSKYGSPFFVQPGSFNDSAPYNPPLIGPVQMITLKNPPTLSVIIPCWSVTPNLTQMALALAKQVRPMCDELIITEDGKYSEELKEIATKYLIHPRLGHGANLRLGLESATCDFVAMIDSDIEILKGNLKDLCVPNEIITPEWNRKDSIMKSNLLGWFLVAPREILMKYPPFDLSAGEGIDDWVRNLEISFSDKVEYLHHGWTSYGKKHEMEFEEEAEKARRAAASIKEIDPMRHFYRIREDPLYAEIWGNG